MENEKLKQSNDVIKMGDVLAFLSRRRMSIGIWLVAGLLAAGAYLLLVPKKYEVTLHLRMAQFGNNLAVIEDPSSLIERLRMPSTYSEAVLKACGLPLSNENSDYLNGILKANGVRAMPMYVEMKLRTMKPELLGPCAEGVVEMIVQQQGELIDERLVGRREDLAAYQLALKTELQEIVRLGRNSTETVTYLARLDKLSGLRSRVDQIEEELRSSHLHPAKLLAPIQVPTKPVLPKINLILGLGALLGLLIGILTAFIREGWTVASSR